MKSPSIFSPLSTTTLLLVIIVLTETTIVLSSSLSSSSASQQQQQQQQQQQRHHQKKKLRGLITTDTTADTTTTTTTTTENETLQQHIIREPQMVREPPRIMGGPKGTTIINDTETTITITNTTTSTTTDDRKNEDKIFLVLPGDTSPTYGGGADADAASGGSTLTPRCLVCGSNSRTVMHPTTIVELPNGSLSSCSALEAAGRLGFFSSTYCSTTIIPFIVAVCGGCTTVLPAPSSPVYVDSTEYADSADVEYWSQAAITDLWDGAVDWVTVFLGL